MDPYPVGKTDHPLRHALPEDLRTLHRLHGAAGTVLTLVHHYRCTLLLNYTITVVHYYRCTCTLLLLYTITVVLTLVHQYRCTMYTITIVHRYRSTCTPLLLYIITVLHVLAVEPLSTPNPPLHRLYNPCLTPNSTSTPALYTIPHSKSHLYTGFMAL